jgi:hypothetical protein
LFELASIMSISGKKSPGSQSESPSSQHSQSATGASSPPATLTISAASVDKEIEILLGRLATERRGRGRESAEAESNSKEYEVGSEVSDIDSEGLLSDEDSKGAAAAPSAPIVASIPPLEAYAIPPSLNSSIASFSVQDGDVQAQRDLLESHMITLISECQAHFLDVKRRLFEERDKLIATRDSFYNENIVKQQKIIESLCQDLSRTNSAMEKEVTRLNLIITRILNMYGQRLISHIGKYSILKIFMNWKNYSAERKRLSQMCKMADAFNRKILLQRSFHGLIREHFANRIENNEKQARYRFDETARQLVERYEGEILRLRQDANDAYAALRLEQYRRQQLEEDLRRMFLKNMTVMNMEALSLFQQPAPEPPMFSSVVSTADANATPLQHEEPNPARLEALREQLRSQQQALQQNRGTGVVPAEAGASSVSSSRPIGSTAPRMSSTTDSEDLQPRLQVPVRIMKAVHPSKGSGPSSARPKK